MKLDTRVMDEWLAQWPNAEVLCLSQSRQTAGVWGCSLGAPAFDRNVGAWISAWVRHLGTKGIPPEQLALLIQDEPRDRTEDIEPLLAWAKAIHAAEPKVRIWEDTCYEDLADAARCTVRSLRRSLSQSAHVAGPQRVVRPVYRDQQRNGRTLQLYSCGGPARLLDPYSYYRLQAWQCWHIGGTGSFFWAFGDNGKASSWNEYLVGAEPDTPLFLDNTTVTAGKQMEAIREGVEDYEYFVLLRNAVEKAKAAGRSHSSLSQAESLLAKAADEVLAPASRPNELRWHAPKDRTKADAVRIHVLEALSALQSH